VSDNTTQTTSGSEHVQPGKFSGFFDRNGWWYVSAALMIVVVLGLIAILVLPGGSEDDGTAAPEPTEQPPAPLSSPASPQSESTSTGTGWNDLGCNGTKGNGEEPFTAPEATWEPVGTMVAPVSETYGPKRVDGAIRSCYQHSPTGAIFAGFNLMIAIHSASDGERSGVIDSAMTAGAFKNETMGAELGDPGWRLVAYDIEACNAERCNVAFIIEAGASLGRLYLPMVWSQGDWRIDGTRDGGGGPVESIPAGYVSWEA